MKDKNGFVYISLLIIIVILLILMVNLTNSLVMRKDLLKGKLGQIKSFNSSESKILISLGDEYYIREYIYPYILNSFRNKSYLSHEFKLRSKDLINDDFNRMVYVKFDDNLNRKDCPNIAYIRAESVVNKSKSTLIGDIKLCNDIFIKEIPIIIEDDSYKLTKFFNGLDENMLDLYRPKKNFISVEDYTSDIFEIFEDDSNELVLLKNEKQYIYLNENNIRLFAINDGGCNVYIDKYMDLQTTIYLSGILYINGNLIINNDFDFKGIIVIKNGQIIIKNDNSLIVDGIIISNNRDVISSDKNMKVKYNRELIFNFGPYLPGYLDLELNNIREE